MTLIISSQTFKDVHNIDDLHFAFSINRDERETEPWIDKKEQRKEAAKVSQDERPRATPKKQAAPKDKQHVPAVERKPTAEAPKEAKAPAEPVKEPVKTKKAAKQAREAAPAPTPTPTPVPEAKPEVVPEKQEPEKTMTAAQRKKAKKK